MILLALLSLSTCVALAAPTRKVVVHKDEVVTVKTALGIATIIQVPDQPSSVVLGDAAAFKVEYLDQAITIKPLHGRAVSNLFIHTDYDRFSVKLVTGAQVLSDYVVYLAPFREPKPRMPGGFDKSLSWKVVGLAKNSQLGKVILSRIAKTSDRVFIEMEITAKNSYRLDPGIFWLSQGLQYQPIQELLLSSLEVKAGRKVTATLVIRKSDLKLNKAISVEVRSKDKVSFPLRKELVWNE